MARPKTSTPDDQWEPDRMRQAREVNLLLGMDSFVELLRIIPDEFYSRTYRQQSEAWQRIRRAVRFGCTDVVELSLLVHKTSLTPELSQ